MSLIAVESPVNDKKKVVGNFLSLPESLGSPLLDI
jgi:hypothetical protein